jgi:tetratricopeptide (TPR) repeat protein
MEAAAKDGQGAGGQGAGKQAAGKQAAGEQAASRPAQDIRIIRSRDLSAEQLNDLCATCHAKMVPLSLSFTPGDKFFDHFDLATLEHADFYPDGRDLGENYTYTSWLMSPCLKSGKLDCNHCHTPSGRMRFEGEQANQSCMPCHANEVNAAAEHGHHPPGSKGNECVGCHMPMTRFAAMGRSDHSMRPPMPAATLAFKSPNACNLCHADKDAAWSEDWVRKWYKSNYQVETVRRGQLIDAARKSQWSRLGEMLAELDKKEPGPVYKTSLVRLLRTCSDPRVRPALLRALEDPSPLVRSAAASALGDRLTPEVVKKLLAAARDPSRLVRIRAALALAAVAPETLADQRDREGLARAIAEFKTAMQARPDDWASYANLGNFYMEGGQFHEAVKCFETSYKLEPRSIGPMVNAAIAYSNLNRNEDAERCLRRALAAEPANPAANFNLGLLLGEEGRLEEAERALRLALKGDPGMAAAAYNLGVIVAKENLDEALLWCRKAHELRPDDPKYAHTLAFYLREKGDTQGAIQVLRETIRRQPGYLDSYLLLADVYEAQGDNKAAAQVYREALARPEVPPALKDQLKAKLLSLQRPEPAKALP